MKRHTLYTFPALALLLAATACTQDDAGTLPDGTQPLTLTAAIEGSADTRATVDNRCRRHRGQRRHPRHRGQPVERR